MWLAVIALANFKCFADESGVSLDWIGCLIGPNGTAKGSTPVSCTPGGMAVGLHLARTVARGTFHMHCRPVRLRGGAGGPLPLPAQLHGRCAHSQRPVAGGREGPPGYCPALRPDCRTPGTSQRPRGAAPRRLPRGADAVLGPECAPDAIWTR